MATPDHDRLDRIVAEARRAADERAKGYRDDNPPDGSNWELLCLYCHDNEH
ncbi:MAG: HNH endonuclease, partial [Burkholderiaceae bacterium]